MDDMDKHQKEDDNALSQNLNAEESVEEKHQTGLNVTNNDLTNFDAFDSVSAHLTGQSSNGMDLVAENKPDEKTINGTCSNTFDAFSAFDETPSSASFINGATPTFVEDMGRLDNDNVMQDHVEAVDEDHSQNNDTDLRTTIEVKIRNESEDRCGTVEQIEKKDSEDEFDDFEGADSVSLRNEDIRSPEVTNKTDSSQNEDIMKNDLYTPTNISKADHADVPACKDDNKVTPDKEESGNNFEMKIEVNPISHMTDTNMLSNEDIDDKIETMEDNGNDLPVLTPLSEEIMTINILQPKIQDGITEHNDINQLETLDEKQDINTFNEGVFTSIEPPITEQIPAQVENSKKEENNVLGNSVDFYNTPTGAQPSFVNENTADFEALEDYTNNEIQLSLASDATSDLFKNVTNPDPKTSSEKTESGFGDPKNRHIQDESVQQFSSNDNNGKESGDVENFSTIEDSSQQSTLKEKNEGSLGELLSLNTKEMESEPQSFHDMTEMNDVDNPISVLLDPDIPDEKKDDDDFEDGEISPVSEEGDKLEKGLHAVALNEKEKEVFDIQNSEVFTDSKTEETLGRIEPTNGKDMNHSDATKESFLERLEMQPKPPTQDVNINLGGIKDISEDKILSYSDATKNPLSITSADANPEEKKTETYIRKANQDNVSCSIMSEKSDEQIGPIIDEENFVKGLTVPNNDQTVSSRNVSKEKAESDVENFDNSECDETEMQIDTVNEKEFHDLGELQDSKLDEASNKAEDKNTRKENSINHDFGHFVERNRDESMSKSHRTTGDSEENNFGDFLDSEKKQREVQIDPLNNKDSKQFGLYENSKEDKEIKIKEGNEIRNDKIIDDNALGSSVESKEGGPLEAAEKKDEVGAQAFENTHREGIVSYQETSVTKDDNDFGEFTNSNVHEVIEDNGIPNESNGIGFGKFGAFVNSATEGLSVATEISENEKDDKSGTFQDSNVQATSAESETAERKENDNLEDDDFGEFGNFTHSTGTVRSEKKGDDDFAAYVDSNGKGTVASMETLQVKKCEDIDDDGFEEFGASNDSTVTGLSVGMERSRNRKDDDFVAFKDSNETVTGAELEASKNIGSKNLEDDDFGEFGEFTDSSAKLLPLSTEVPEEKNRDFAAFEYSNEKISGAELGASENKVIDSLKHDGLEDDGFGGFGTFTNSVTEGSSITTEKSENEKDDNSGVFGDFSTKATSTMLETLEKKENDSLEDNNLGEFGEFTDSNAKQMSTEAKNLELNKHKVLVNENFGDFEGSNEDETTSMDERIQNKENDGFTDFTAANEISQYVEVGKVKKESAFDDDEFGDFADSSKEHIKSNSDIFHEKADKDECKDEDFGGFGSFSEANTNGKALLDESSHSYATNTNTVIQRVFLPIKDANETMNGIVQEYNPFLVQSLLDSIDLNGCSQIKWSDLALTAFMNQKQMLGNEPQSVIIKKQSCTPYSQDGPKVDLRKPFVSNNKILTKESNDKAQVDMVAHSTADTSIQKENKEENSVTITKSDVNASQENQKSNESRSSKIRGGAFAIRNAIRGIRTGVNSPSTHLSSPVEHLRARTKNKDSPTTHKAADLFFSQIPDLSYMLKSRLSLPIKSKENLEVTIKVKNPNTDLLPQIHVDNPRFDAFQ